MKDSTLTSLFIRTREKLRNVARRFVDEREVDDLLQEAFIKLWSSNRESSEPLAVVTVRNLAIDATRRQKARCEVSLPESPTPEEANDDDDKTDRNELYDRVNRLIANHLSERDRRILLLRDRNGWEIAEIAEDTGLNEANIRMILSRSRKIIRELYRESTSKPLQHPKQKDE